MSAKRYKEALTVAKNAHKTLGANPRTLTVRFFILFFFPFSIASESTLLTADSGLRWLKTVSSTFQDVDFHGSQFPLLIN